MKPKILVTGGAGFIGSHTALELIAAGFHPILVDDLSASDLTLVNGLERILGQRPEFHKIDCTNEGEMRKIFDKHPDFAGVIHFAAYKSVHESVLNPYKYYTNNLGSLLTLIHLMKEFSVKHLIFSSSCTVYGQPDVIPVTESTPFKTAQSPYGATKQMCERILEDEVVADPALRVLALRYFNPIGAHPSGLIGELPIGIPGNLVPFITQTAIGKRKSLTVFGNDYQTPDGSCLRDFIHVVDLAKAHVRALQVIENIKSHFEPINVGSGIPISVLELVNSFIRVTGAKLTYTIGPRRPGDVEKVYADSQKSMDVLQWKTELSADDALRDAWRWEQQLSHAAH
jgi:UDP-glucose 4-epimerase